MSTDRLRRDESEFLGRRRWEMPIIGVTKAQLLEHVALCERHETFRRFEYQTPGTDGSIQYYSVSGKPVFDERGAFMGYHGIGRNVTALRKAEMSIKDSEQKMRQIVHGNPVPSFVLDIHQRVTHWNQACANLTHLTEQEMVNGAPLWRAFFANPHPTLAELILSGASEREIASHFEKGRRSDLIDDAFEAEMCFDRPGDPPRWFAITAAPLKDSDGQVVGAIETLRDITSEIRAQAVLEKLASHDGLTGVGNRRIFDKTLAVEWKRAKRESLSLSLLMIDVDHFKCYNDTFGHQAGDMCLRRIAVGLSQQVMRPSDLVARYGGEEFAVILVNTEERGARVVAQRILDQVRELAIPHPSEPWGYVSLSIGVTSMRPQQGMDADSLISWADKALYQAKDQGRNRYLFY